MIALRNLWFFFISIVLILININSFANDVLDENDVNIFQKNCWPIRGYDIELRFAPVRPRSEEEKSEDQWSYKFITDDKKYPENTINLPKDGSSVRVDLVLILKRSESAIKERYLWTVIVGPRNTGWGFGGFWPTEKSMKDYDRLSDKKESLITIDTLSARSDGPVHSKISDEDIGNSTILNDAWIDIFGEKVVSDLVYLGSDAAKDNKEGYSLTFYHVPTPALNLINPNGYKWPSSKHIDKPGKVFGFVLTPDGECLVGTSINVVE